MTIRAHVPDQVEVRVTRILSRTVLQMIYMTILEEGMGSGLAVEEGQLKGSLASKKERTAGNARNCITGNGSGIVYVSK